MASETETDTQTESRRKFLWDAAKTFTWGAITLTCVPAFAEKTTVGGELGPGDHIYGFLVDTTKCIGCCRCVQACKTENKPPDGQNRTWMERYVYLKNGNIEVDTHTKVPPYAFEELPGEKAQNVLKSFFVAKLCNHCHNSPCIQVCPVGASYQTDEGFVLIDQKRCIGCSYCVQACPFGTRFVNADTQVADKCTWCYHRVKKGLNPACVEACPTGTRTFGNIADPESEISKALGENRVDVLKSYLGTQPRTRYIGLTTDVV